MKRRTFIKAASAGLGGAFLGSCAGKLAASRPSLTDVSPVSRGSDAEIRTYLGADYWGNRLQDWRYNNGRIECLNDEKDFEIRTVSLLTRELNSSSSPGRISARVQPIAEGDGFSGFLLGVGAGRLDYRAAALANRVSGEGGGFMAVIDDKGQLSFRDFSDSEKTLSYEKYEFIDDAGASDLTVNWDNGVVLDCHIDPVEGGLFDVRLIAYDAKTDAELGFIVRTGVESYQLTGGMMLLSSSAVGTQGSRWSFADVRTGGDKIDVDQSRGLEPLMGCMHSLNRNVMKMTAQFMPINLDKYPRARLEYKKEGDANWSNGQTRDIEDGFVALYRVDDWDYTKNYKYRIVWPDSDQTLFEGEIVADPQNSKELKIALYSCIIPTARALDREGIPKKIPQEKTLGRYTPENIFFPHTQVVENCDGHEPDLYVFCGDQYYETYPVRRGSHTKDAKLDTLYRWYLWYWTYRESVRNRPSIMVADDHDVLQGNLWGNAGDASEMPKEEDGGFKWDKSVVRMVYRMQHGHNPDAYDPTPIKYDIPVTYGSFVYGGTSFAVVEDRKFKSPPDYVTNPLDTRGELLGARQEAFLKAWKDMDVGLPKVVITASIWGSPQTDDKGEPLLDYDANGFPPDGRTRAVKLVADAKALVIAGDQHLGMVAHQGVNDFDDGALFFAGPATAAFWQRWFEGGGKLDNQYKGGANTGNFVDTFGNKMRVLAVSNPKITHAEFEAGNETWGKFIADRDLKSEGYGIIKVRHDTNDFVLENWPWDANPKTGKQFDGWPITHKYTV